MSNISLTDAHIQQFDTLNKLFESTSPKLSKILTFDNLINEAHALNTIESNIPESLRFDLHLDLIFNGGVTDYYKSMSSGTNYILEVARKIFPNSQRITESIESFKEYLGSLLNEDALALSMPIDSASIADPLKARGGGFWGTLKSLWNAITEGGSVIGIIHFIIDIIGLVGDFIFPGVGVVADIINAIIYAVRGEWIQCSISVIAAVVIGGGDALKLVRYAAKPAQRALGLLAKEGGAKAAGEMIAKLPAKEGGGVIKLLTGIFGNIGGALGKASSLFGTFIQKFGEKVARYIPGLGKALKPIFDGLGTTLTAFGKKMSLCSANFKLATKAAKKEAAITIDAATKAGGDFVFDGPWVKVFNKEGKQIGRYPAKQFDKISGEALVTATTKKAGSAEGSKILYKTGDDVADVARTLVNPKVQGSMRKRAYDYFETTARKKGWKRMVNTKNLAFFVGKQIYKIIFKSDWLDGGAGSNWSPGEVEGHGNGAINDWINDRMDGKKNKTLLLDSQDQEVVDRITDYQNHFAEITGEPRIINVVTNKLEKDGPAEEFEDFFNEVAKGNVTRGEKGDMSDHTTSDKLAADTKITESKKSVIRTISNFSDFNK